MQCFISISESSSEIHEDLKAGVQIPKAPEGASSNPAGVNISRLTSPMSDYHEKLSVHLPIQCIRKLLQFSTSVRSWSVLVCSIAHFGNCAVLNLMLCSVQF